MFVRLKRWLEREPPLERLVDHLQSENYRLREENAALLDKVLLKEGFAGISPAAIAERAAYHQEPTTAFEDDEALKAMDEQKELEERAALAATDPDEMEMVIARIEAGDTRWIKVRERAEQLMRPSH